MTSALSTIVTRTTSASEPGTMRDTRPSDHNRLLRAKTCAPTAHVHAKPSVPNEFRHRRQVTGHPSPVRCSNSLMSKTASEAARRVKRKPEHDAVHDCNHQLGRGMRAGAQRAFLDSRGNERTLGARDGLRSGAA
jgi:hypothetical protein